MCWRISPIPLHNPTSATTAQPYRCYHRTTLPVLPLHNPTSATAAQPYQCYRCTTLPVLQLHLPCKHQLPLTLGNFLLLTLHWGTSPVHLRKNSLSTIASLCHRWINKHTYIIVVEKLLIWMIRNRTLLLWKARKWTKIPWVDYGGITTDATGF